MDRPRRVSATLQGPAIAKWWRQHPPQGLHLAFACDSFVVVGSNCPIVRDLDDPLEIPFMDEHSYVEFAFRPQPFEGCDSGQIIITAVCALQGEGVPVGECDRVEVRVA